MEEIKKESIEKLNKAISEYFSENFREKEPFFVKGNLYSDYLFGGRNMVLYNGEIYWADYDGKENAYLLKEMDFANKYRLLKGDDLIIEYKHDYSRPHYFDDELIEKIKALKILGYESLYSLYIKRDLNYCNLYFMGKKCNNSFTMKIIFYDDLRVKIHNFVLDSNKINERCIKENGDEIIYCDIKLNEFINKREQPKLRFVKVGKGED